MTEGKEDFTATFNLPTIVMKVWPLNSQGTSRGSLLGQGDPIISAACKRQPKSMGSR